MMASALDFSGEGFVPWRWSPHRPGAGSYGRGRSAGRRYARLARHGALVAVVGAEPIGWPWPRWTALRRAQPSVSTLAAPGGARPRPRRDAHPWPSRAHRASPGSPRDAASAREARPRRTSGERPPRSHHGHDQERPDVRRRATTAAIPISRLGERDAQVDASADRRIRTRPGRLRSSRRSTRRSTRASVERRVDQAQVDADHVARCRRRSAPRGTRTGPRRRPMRRLKTWYMRLTLP